MTASLKEMALLKFQTFYYLHSIFQRKTFLNFSQPSSHHWYSYFSKQNFTLQNLSLLQKKKKNFFPLRCLTQFPPLLRKVYTQDQNKKGHSSSPEPTTEIDDTDNDFDEAELNSILYKTSESLYNTSSVAVLQPWIKWGPQKRWETTPDILLSEACSLVHSLPFMRISYKEHISLQSITKKYIFGSGNLLRLKRTILENQCQAVFISINHLSSAQKRALEEHFGVPVFDRFFIVLAIFKHHANTLEARLQIALAEMPMMRKYYLHDKEKLLYDQKALKLKKALESLETKRNAFRKSRQKSSIPTVAVVGYTNCGKTTLIHAITGDDRAQGEDRLFATLDMTVHKGILPCGLSVLFMDSVGFIQDIPTSLVASFKATFQDIIYSDVVVVVRDMSHPDHVGQMNTVRKTLRSLPLPKETPVIIVNNKSDLIPEDTDIHDSFLQEGIVSSAITGKGLKEVVANIESEVLRVTGRKMYIMRLLTGSSKIQWLKDNAAVSSEEIDEKDSQYTVVKVFLNYIQKITFKKVFQL